MSNLHSGYRGDLQYITENAFNKQKLRTCWIFMADHAGGLRSVVNPGTKLWRPPVEVTQFWRLKSGFGARFLYDQKRLYWSRGGLIVWNKSCWKWFKLLFGFILMNLFLFGFTKTKTGAKTAPRAPKLSYFDGQGPQLSARVNHGTPAAGVISHILFFCWKSRLL